MDNQDLLFFKDDNSINPARSVNKPWKVIIADDEEEVHIMTKMVMRKFQFQDRPMELLTAYSGEQTKELMQAHDDVAIVLLDVVMEHENSGLEVVKFIREELKNPFVRIILRTGQPGQAPQDDVIRNYDINDYKSKTELTVQKLYTAIIASLRSYTDMQLIDKNRRGLELILNQSRELFNLKDTQFDPLILEHYKELLALEYQSTEQISGAIIQQVADVPFIVCGYGQFEEMTDVSLDSEAHRHWISLLEQSCHGNDVVFEDNLFAFCYTSAAEVKKFVIVEAPDVYTELQRDLVRMFANNAKVAYDNILLNSEIIDTQKEVIVTLGEIVETRSKETANHVVRVAEYSYLFALLCGLSEEEANLLRLASPMHDIGKVGIPDHILNKPGKLTPEEFEVIKSHTIIGYEVLKTSKRQILKTAATIALSHHERWDGKGYPYGKSGEEIDLYSRITSLADVYDALSHKRVYKEAWPEEQVVTFIESESGKMFQPELVRILVDNLERFVEIRKIYPDE